MRALFQPILAGAELGDRLWAALGAFIGIAVVAALCSAFAPGHTLLLAGPIGASALLVFAVPASPLAQPWPVIVGNTLSALVGTIAARFIPVPALAAGVAVGAAIVAMSLTRSLHPPGGAAALLAVLGGPPVAAAGVWFAAVPVGLNAVLLVLAGTLYHHWSGHSYPHRPLPAAGPQSPIAAVPHPEDLDAALAEAGEAFDISREDLELLFRRAEYHAQQRKR